MANELDVALIIGVDHYPRQNLRKCGALANADAVETWFFDSCDEIRSTPKVISLRSGHGRGANIDDVIDGVGELCEHYGGPGSRLLFYFSGHGTVDENRHDVLLCEDTGRSGILLDDMIRYFSYFPFEKQLFVVDACRELENEIAGLSVFQLRRNTPLPRVAYRPQVMTARSTSLSHQSFADTARVEAREPGIPCGYFTTGLIEYACRPQSGVYRLIPELNAIGIRASGLQNVMQEYLRDRGQYPNINSGGEIELWHSPLFFDRRRAQAGDWSTEPLFPEDRPDRMRYRRFVRSVLAALGGLDDQRRAITALSVAPAKKYGVFYLAPVAAPVADWLVRHVLFGDGQPQVEIQTIDLTGNGVQPELAEFWEKIESAFGTRAPAELVQRLTGSTALCVVLEYVRAREMTTEILAEFWTPVAAQCIGSSKSFFLVLIASDDAARPALAQAPGAQECPPLALVTADSVEAWVDRFRHELRLDVARDRTAFARKVVQDKPTLPALIERICHVLNVDAQWMI